MTIDARTTTAAHPKKVHIETWGCQMNVADSEKMLQLLKGENFTLTTSEQDADLVVLNTCHIREKAKHKVLSRLGVLNQLKKQRPDMRIAVAGCVAQAEGKRLLRDSDGIDVLLGPGKIDELPNLLRSQEQTQKPAIATGFNAPSKQPATENRPASQDLGISEALTGKNEVTRYLNIVQGCNNFCTFCVVPFTRGREISRLPREILTEAEGLLAGGAKELMLLGQNVNSYGLDLQEPNSTATLDGGPFVELLKAVAALPKLERLRFTTSNPHDFTYELANLFAVEAKMGRYLHLPVQSGNDRILEVMRRKVTVEEYRQRIKWLRDIDPEMAISTDLIVGFPGETEEEFEDTLRLIEEVRYSFSFAFKYSPRPNTAAARFKEQIPEKIKDERLSRLNALQDKVTMEIHSTEIGRTREVLIAYESKRSPGLFYGRTPQYRLVRLRSNNNIVGETVSVLITGGNKTALEGVLK